MTDTALIDGLLPVNMQSPDAALELDEELELLDEVLLLELDEPPVKVMLVMV